MDLHDPPILSYPVVQDDGTVEIPNGPIEGNLDADPGDRVVVAVLGTFEEGDRHLVEP